MTQHTPGPWNDNSRKPLPLDPDPEWDLACAVWTADGEFFVCSAKGPSKAGKFNRLSPQERHANMRLIAAAPELLAALRRAVAGVMDPEARQLAKAAIAKAEGSAVQ